MQLSKSKVNPNLKRQIRNLLYQVIADIKDTKEAKEFVESFLTKTEVDMASRRLGIAYYLSKGRTYANIKNNLAVSSATVSSIAEQMRAQKGTQIALNKINANEWADKWAEKISKLVKGMGNKSKGGSRG